MKEDIWDVLARYISRESIQDDHDSLESWKAQDPKNKNSIHLFSTARFRKRKADNKNREVVFEDILSKIQKERSRPSVRLWTRASIAATIALLIGTATSFYFLGNRKSVVQTVEMYAPRGIKSKVVLPDGSLIMLNSDSKLTYPVTFESKTREVYLNGEAYFSIKKDKNRPFVVKTGSVDVKVLGTKFNLKAYANDNFVATTLDEGLVSLSGNSPEIKPVSLTPGKQAVWDKSKKSMSVTAVNQGIYSGWCEGKYYFNKNSFEQIAHTLEIGFNVTIDIQSQNLKKEIFSGDFVRGENIEQILSVIKMNTKIKYKIVGSRILINEK